MDRVPGWQRILEALYFLRNYRGGLVWDNQSVPGAGSGTSSLRQALHREFGKTRFRGLWANQKPAFRRFG